MRFESIDHLNGDEILGEDILDDKGQILIKEGFRVSDLLIKKLKRYGKFRVYIKDDRFSDVILNSKLTELKKTAIGVIPNLFNSMMENNKKIVRGYLSRIEYLIDEIIECNSINMNLYEMKMYDNYTYIHCIDTGIMSIYLGSCFNLKKDELKELGLAGVLHDIGKIKINSNIINKKGSLTSEEFNEIKKHPIYGKNILEKSRGISKFIIDGVVQHHERVDGKGYPYGLFDEEICDYAKIISVSDVFTAISANRSYRLKFDPKEAYEYILAGSGTKFNLSVTQKFKRNFAIYPLGSCVKLSNGIEGYVVRQNLNLPDRPVVRVVYDSKTKRDINIYEIDLLKEHSIIIKDII